MLHKALNGAVHRHSQDVGRLVCGGEHKAVEQLFHSEGLAHLDVGSREVAGQALVGGVPRGDGGLQGELARLDGLQHQQAGGQLGGAGRVGPLAGAHVVEDLAVVGVQQNGVGAEEVQVLLGGGGRNQQGEDDGQNQKQRKKTIFFHGKISICMI